MMSKFYLVISDFFCALIFAAFLIVSNQFLFAQPVTQEWAKTYNSGYDVSRGIAVDKPGNVFVLGSDANDSGNITTIKYSPSGIQQWVKIYIDSAASIHAPTGIAVDSSGNAYVIGFTECNSLFYYVCIKYDTNGVVKWLKKISRNTMGYPYSICVDKSNFIYVSGISGDSAFIIKYNTSGDSLWIKKYSGPDRTASGDIIITNDSNLYVCGLSMNWITFNYDYLTLKYDINGNFKWAAVYPGGLGILNTLSDIDVDRFGNVIIAGTVTFGGFPRYEDYATIKYNWAGIQQWAALYNGPASYHDYAHAVKADMNGNIYVTGSSYWGSNQGGYNVTTIKYNLNGDSLWVRSYTGPGNNDDSGNDIDSDSSGNMYLTGEVEGIGCVTIKYNTYGEILWVMSYPNGYGRFIEIDNQKNVYVSGWVGLSPDLLTIKYSQLVGVEPVSNNFPGKFSLSQNYPNPFNSVTKIKFNVPVVGAQYIEPLQLRIFDILGREIAVLVNEQFTPGTYEIDWDATNYPSGVYFYSLTTGDPSTGSGLRFADTKKMVLLK